MKRGIAALLSGVVFAVGLCVSGMTRPSKIVGFLDFFGAWDPSLAFVMVGAVSVSAIAFRLARRRPAPILGGAFRIPSSAPIRWRLVGGAALFGAGWGISGFCPGPAVVSLAGAGPGAAVFVLSMLAGMAIVELSPRLRGSPDVPSDCS